MIVPKVVLQGW